MFGNSEIKFIINYSTLSLKKGELGELGELGDGAERTIKLCDFLQS